MSEHLLSFLWFGLFSRKPYHWLICHQEIDESENLFGFNQSSICCVNFKTGHNRPETSLVNWQWFFNNGLDLGQQEQFVQLEKGAQKGYGSMVLLVCCSFLQLQHVKHFSSFPDSGDLMCQWHTLNRNKVQVIVLLPKWFWSCLSQLLCQFLLHGCCWFVSIEKLEIIGASERFFVSRLLSCEFLFI